ncbi:MAG TPA: glycoside hydrolase family 88 protein [Longimicrobiales bacterium]|nr:glycoside hydrolase family 88 protein [Longimicrobiales bacterium]
MKRSGRYAPIAYALLFLALTPQVNAQTFARRMADATIARNPAVHKEWDYTAGLILLAMQRLGDATANPQYNTYVRKNIDDFVQADGSIKTYELEEFNLDQINEGRVLFPLYQRTKAPKYRKAIETLREQLRQQPRTKEGGFWHKKVYPQQMWLDGIYMASPFLAQYAQAFGDTAAFNDVAKQILLVARNTRDAKTGLYYHAWDESRSQIWADTATGRSANFWGRAVGWYAMAIVDVLDYLPATHRDRAQIIRIMNDLAGAISAVQDPVTGLWYDILDQPSRPGNYHETSASSMFVYALAKAARNGWIDGKYRDVARRGYDGMIKNVVTTDENGRVSLDRIVSVSGLGGKQQRNGSFEYYISEPVVSNDYKGVGAFILASLELQR